MLISENTSQNVNGPNEDVNGNGLLDIGEDINGNGVLDSHRLTKDDDKEAET